MFEDYTIEEKIALLLFLGLSFCLFIYVLAACTNKFGI